MPKQTAPSPEPGDDNKPVIPGTREVQPAVPDLLARIEAMEDRGEDETEDIAASIIARYLTAETVDDILAPQRAVPAKDIVGQPFMLHDVRWNESTVEEDGTFPLYAVLEVVLHGKGCAVTCGSRNVMAQVTRLKEKNFLPVAVKISQLPGKTRRGFKPLFLEHADLPTFNGDTDEEPF